MSPEAPPVVADRRGLAALAAAVFLVALAAHVMHLRALPPIAAVHEGLGLTLPGLARLHAWLGTGLTVVLAGGLAAALAAAFGVRRTAAVVPALAALAAASLVVVVAGLVSTGRSLEGAVVDALMTARGKAGYAERGTMALVAGDLARAETELVAARNMPSAGGLACVSSPGYAALQLAEIRRQQGRVGEARGFYAAAISESERGSCIDATSPYSVAATARARMASLAGAPVTAPPASQPRP